MDKVLMFWLVVYALLWLYLAAKP